MEHKSNILDFTGISRLGVDPQRVLSKASDKELEDVIVIGRTQEGHLYFHASSPDGADVLWLMELTKKNLLSGELDD